MINMERDLYSAVYLRDYQLLLKLLKSGSDPNSQFFESFILHWAVGKKSHPDILNTLIGYGANINALDKRYGCSPLHWAVRLNYVDMVKYLLLFGAVVNVTDRELFTPLCWGVSKNKTDREIIKLLLDFGSDVHMKNNEGFDAVYYAKQTYRYNQVLESLRDC